MKEFHWYAEDEVPLQEFFYLSDLAIARREQRIKATKEHKIFLD